jgi:putative acetyltransferase
MKIRGYEARDAEGVAAVFRRSIESLGPRNYSAEQVAAWVGRAPDAAGFHARAMDGRVFLVAADDADRPVAFADLEADGHVDMLYCAPEAAGTGLVVLLYATLEAIARQRGMTRLYSEASEPALRFFLRRGYVHLHRRDLMIGGVAIHNHAVEKQLD